MNIQEINSYFKGHVATLEKVLDILERHINIIPTEILKELKEYHDRIDYESSAMMNAHSLESEVTL